MVALRILLLLGWLTACSLVATSQQTNPQTVPQQGTQVEATTTATQPAAVQESTAPKSSPVVDETPTQLKTISGHVDSIPGTIWMANAVVAIVLLACCTFIIFLLLTRLPMRPNSPVVASKGPAPLDLRPLEQRLDDRYRELSALIVDLKAGLAQQMIPAAPQPIQETRQEESRPTPVPQAGGFNVPADKPKSGKAKSMSAVATASSKENFEDLYQRLTLEQNSSDLIASNPITVNFRTPEAIDKNPDRPEPLVKDNSGTLMLFASAGLPKGEYYVAPSLDFGGVWSETHTRTWRSLFDFASPKARTLTKAAVVRADGNEWVLVKKGFFS